MKLPSEKKIEAALRKKDAAHTRMIRAVDAYAQAHALFLVLCIEGDAAKKEAAKREPAK